MTLDTHKAARSQSGKATDVTAALRWRGRCWEWRTSRILVCDRMSQRIDGRPRPRSGRRVGFTPLTRRAGRVQEHEQPGRRRIAGAAGAHEIRSSMIATGVSRTPANAGTGSICRAAAKQGSVASRWQRTESVRARADVFSTRYKISSNRPNECTWMCGLGRGEAGCRSVRG
jgi:hypothetical protein